MACRQGGVAESRNGEHRVKALLKKIWKGSNEDMTTEDANQPTTTRMAAPQPPLAMPPASSDVRVYLEYTPNPNAFKFITSLPVKGFGKTTYGRVDECQGVPLAREIFAIDGVTQLHFFENVITVTFADDERIGERIDKVKNVLIRDLPAHDPFFATEMDETARRAALSPELQQIEAILDRTIRPGLQGDGGDLEVISLEGNTLSVRYQGACGSCPSSTAGTLMAIQGILREEFNPELEIQSL